MTNRSRRPLVWTYVGAHMERECTNCGAEADDWCRRPDGQVRAIPCVARMRSDATPLTPSAGATQLTLGDDETSDR